MTTRSTGSADHLVMLHRNTAGRVGKGRLAASARATGSMLNGFVGVRRRGAL